MQPPAILAVSREMPLGNRELRDDSFFPREAAAMMPSAALSSVAQPKPDVAIVAACGLP